MEAEHRVTPLELFFDLVFVFGFTQVTTLMADEASWAGLGRGLLVLSVLWWAWASYAWLTNAFDPDTVTFVGQFALAARREPDLFQAVLRWCGRRSPVAC
jgi:low temperature requirement protein LtrA